MKPQVLLATPERQVWTRLRSEVAHLCDIRLSVSSGQAYKHLQTEAFQVFVTDVKLPKLHTMELAHALWHAPTQDAVFVSWGPLNDIVYVRQVRNWDAMVIPRTFDQLVDALRGILDPAAARTIRDVRYQPKEDTFWVAFHNGRTYEIQREALEAGDRSAIVGEPRIINEGSAFEVRQASGNTYEVPWDLVLYHQEPSYPYHKGKSSRRDAEVNYAERIGTRIRQAREARGWSLGELSRRTGIQPPNLSRLESGKHRPSLETIERVADALGVRVADLVAA